MNIDFDPEKAFQALDQDRDGYVSYYNVFTYVRSVLYTSVSLSEAEAFIKEYDADLDRRLGYREFLNFVLPSTSASLRDIALKRAENSLYSVTYKYSPLSHEVKRAVAELVERELRLVRARKEL